MEKFSSVFCVARAHLGGTDSQEAPIGTIITTGSFAGLAACSPNQLSESVIVCNGKAEVLSDVNPSRSNLTV